MLRYVSLHWRRGDLDLAHPQSSLIKWTPRAAAEKVIKIMNDHCEHEIHPTATGSAVAANDDSNASNGYCGFDSIHLATDLFFTRDFTTFRSLIPSSITIHRHHTDDRILDTAMDLILASQSHYFFSTYGGSSYARFIWQERDQVYHKSPDTHVY